MQLVDEADDLAGGFRDFFQDSLQAILEFATKLGARNHGAQIDRDQALVNRAMEEHVLAYLVKPIEAHQLGPAIQVAWARFEELSSLTAENNSLKQTLHSRKVIERAKGVLMKRYRWSEADAFRRLQRGAMNRRVPMVDLAQAVLDGKEVDLGPG